jgi:hypothetical protein
VGGRPWRPAAKKDGIVVMREERKKDQSRTARVDVQTLEK